MNGSRGRPPGGWREKPGMRVLIVSNYYFPETVGAAVWVPQLATELYRMGHEVTVLTSFPSYPGGHVFEQYCGRFFMREAIGGVRVVRTMTYATPSRAFWQRVLSWGCFCISSLVQGSMARIEADVVYVVMPPLPLGITGWVLAKMAKAPLVINVQDIYPDVAVELKFLTNRVAIRFFRGMERWIYRHARKIVVISPSFRDNLAGKGVPQEKVAVVSNWADPSEIVPLPKQNQFRQEVGAGREDLLLVYSGGLSLNSLLEPLMEALVQFRRERVRLVVLGDGPKKPEIMALAGQLGIAAEFMPFQPLERYGEVLSAADLAVVTLNSAATSSSVPSKIFKHMAAGTASLAITSAPNELTRLIRASGGGLSCDDGTPGTIAARIRWALANREEIEAMGGRARNYLVRECSRSKCVGEIAGVLGEAVEQKCGK